MTALVDRRAGDGKAPLLIAAEHRHVGSSDCECVEALLRAGAAAHAVRKPDGLSAAHLSCAAGCARCLRPMLQRAPQLIDCRCRGGRLPLHAAAAAAAHECVSELLGIGAHVGDPIDAGDGLCPIHLACRAGSRRTIRLLLERRADVHCRDGRGRTPLLHATSALKPRAVAELLSQRADPSCFSGALQAALRKLTDAALAERVDGLAHGPPAREEALRDGGASRGSAALPGTEGGAAARRVWQLAERWARVLACLVRGGASVRVGDLSLLRLGWSEHAAASPGDGSGGGGGGGGGVPSLLRLSERAAAFGLSESTVLPTLHLARMLGAAALASECERLIVQHGATLAELGIFRGAGVRSGAFLRGTLANALRRRAAEAVDDELGWNGVPASEPPAWAVDEDLFCGDHVAEEGPTDAAEEEEDDDSSNADSSDSADGG